MLVVLSTTRIDDRYVTVYAVAPDARTVSVTVPWRESTDDGIAAALHRARGVLLDADKARKGALASYEQEIIDYGTLDDSDTDPSTG